MKRLGLKIVGLNSKSTSVKEMRFFIWLIPLLGISPVIHLHAAPRQNSFYDSQQATALNETRDAVDVLRHQVENQETELRTFENKVESLNAILESLRDQIQDSAAAQKEQWKGNSNSLEMKISALENSAKSLTADLKQLQSHANETSSALLLFKQKLTELDQRIQGQNKNIENLQAALQTLMDAFQMKADLGSTPVSGKSYKVKSGDTLEKIAKANGTTVQVLKELNGMTSDKIVVGKTLKLPE